LHSRQELDQLRAQHAAAAAQLASAEAQLKSAEVQLKSSQEEARALNSQLELVRAGAMQQQSVSPPAPLPSSSSCFSFFFRLGDP
jgi:hypothetical protein